MIPLSEHLRALKWAIGSVLLLVFTAFLFSWAYADTLFHSLIPKIDTTQIELKAFLWKNDSPLAKFIDFPQGTKINGELIKNPFILLPHSEVIATYPIDSSLQLLSPLEGFFSSCKIAFWVAITLTSPLWLYILFQFISPALHDKERAILIPLGLTLLATAFLGFFIAKYYVIPEATDFFHTMNASYGVNFWSLSSYVDYTLMLYFSTIFLLEIVSGLWLMILGGLISHQQLSSARRGVYLGAFIVGAILTPPDVFSQVVAAIFLIAAYEVSCLIARLKKQPG